MKKQSLMAKKGLVVIFDSASVRRNTGLQQL